MLSEVHIRLYHQNIETIYKAVDYQLLNDMFGICSSCMLCGECIVRAGVRGGDGCAASSKLVSLREGSGARD